MRDYARSTGCRMEFLRRQLDDEEAVPCGRCDNCSGARFSDKVTDAALDTARGELGRPGVDVEPRKMWPTGLAAVGISLKGRIPETEQSFTGRALGRLSDIGWGNRLRPMLAPQASDGPVPDDVVTAVVTVLADWAKGPGGWASGAADAPARPVGVVTVASHSRPQLVGSLGARIAEVGRMPLLGTVEYAPEAVDARISRTNSAQRVRGLHEAFAVPARLAEALAEADGPVLLIDDLSDSGWTLAVTARLLRRSGAKGCFRWSLPFRRDKRGQRGSGWAGSVKEYEPHTRRFPPVTPNCSLPHDHAPARIGGLPRGPVRGPGGLCRGAPAPVPARTVGAYAKGGT